MRLLDLHDRQRAERAGQQAVPQAVQPPADDQDDEDRDRIGGRRHLPAEQALLRVAGVVRQFRAPLEQDDRPLAPTHHVVGPVADLVAELVVARIRADRRDARVEVVAQVLGDRQPRERAGQAVLVGMEVGVLIPVRPAEAEEQPQADGGHQDQIDDQAAEAAQRRRTHQFPTKAERARRASARLTARARNTPGSRDPAATTCTPTARRSGTGARARATSAARRRCAGSARRRCRRDAG